MSSKQGNYENEPIEGYLSTNKNRTLLYISFFGTEVAEDGDFAGKRTFDPNKAYLVRWASDVVDLLEGKRKSVPIKKKIPNERD